MNKALIGGMLLAFPVVLFADYEKAVILAFFATGMVVSAAGIILTLDSMGMVTSNKTRSLLGRCMKAGAMFTALWIAVFFLGKL
jgi:VIT1/CCC1 family predicted Fe2+/Mn2+ transporter